VATISRTRVGANPPEILFEDPELGFCNLKAMLYDGPANGLAADAEAESDPQKGSRGLATERAGSLEMGRHEAGSVRGA